MSFSARGVAHRKTVTVTMEQVLFDKVRKAALAERRSVSAFMAIAAEDFFAKGVAHPAPARRKAKVAA